MRCVLYFKNAILNIVSYEVEEVFQLFPDVAIADIHFFVINLEL